MAVVKVRLLSGDRPGTVVEADYQVAKHWIGAELAELVEADKPETPERAASKTRKARSGLETR